MALTLKISNNRSATFCMEVIYYSTNIEEPLVNNCSRNCMDIATEVEGVKLDAVIAKREMKSTIAQNSLAIEDLQTQLNCFADFFCGP